MTITDNAGHRVRNAAATRATILEAARKRYEISYQRYLIGKIDVTELNIALTAQEAARRSYLQSLQQYWMALYEIRGLTLYDFVNDASLMKTPPTGE